MTAPSFSLPPPPDVAWDEAGVLRSRTHGDVYFSRDGGLAESRAVFLAGCGLPGRWRGNRFFAVAELGFGTGLNALATWAEWVKNRPFSDAFLHILSIESQLLGRADAARALAAFPEVAHLADRLLARWPVRARGAQRLWFEGDGVCLTLLQAPAAEALTWIEGPIDAWFLDGFAPARNADMWSADLFQRMAQLSAPGARAATYSVAASVREGLAAAGFTVAKRPGFGKKRERLEAWLLGEAAARGSPGPITIIGGGIAGASVAAAVRRRGGEALVLEKGPTLAHRASGNPAALLMPRFGAGPAQGFFQDAYLFARAAYADLGADVFTPHRIQHWPASETEAQRFARIAADPPLPASLLEAEGAGFAHAGGVVRPALAVQAWTGAAQLNTAVQSLTRTQAGWALSLAGGAALAATHVVFCAGAGALPAPLDWLPLQRRRGQINWGPLSTPAHARASGNYAAPFEDGVMFGATFTAAETDEAAPNAEDTAANLAALAQLSPEMAAGLDPSRLSARACVRAAAPDRIPIAGPALNPDTDDLRALPGLYVLAGLGSRGLMTAPWLGEWIAARIFAEPTVMDPPSRAALAPERFILRARRKGRPFP
jgi:tRNA 5-methylaminomethyl-2-thiouridine biosynthesis bifunctional protein